MVKIKRLIIGVSIVLAVAATSTGIYYGNVKKTISNWENKIYPGITVEGINLSGMTTSEAEKVIKNKYGQVANSKKIILKAGDKEVDINFSDLDPEYDIDDVVSKAMEMGKGDSIFKQQKYIKSGINENLDLTIDYNEDKLKKYEKELKNKVDIQAKDANISIINKKIEINGSVNGQSVDIDDMDELIKKAINSDIIDGLDGKTIVVNIPVKEVVPNITTEKLQSINGDIGSFTSDYSYNSTDARATNIEIALKSINGILLMPGESFSFNDIVGERTEQKGYKNAATFVENQVVDGIGGGICQVSTSLNRAVIRAGLVPTERHNHSLKASYSDYGLDSAVAWGHLDYKFTNTYNKPIYIEAVTNGSRVMTINIYGNVEEKKNKTYELIATDPEVTSKAIVTKVDDPSLESGQEVWESKPIDGYKASSYVVTYESGKELSRKLLGTYNYSKVDGVLKIGTGNASNEQKTEAQG